MATLCQVWDPAWWRDLQAGCLGSGERKASCESRGECEVFAGQSNLSRRSADLGGLKLAAASTQSLFDHVSTGMVAGDRRYGDRRAPLERGSWAFGCATAGCSWTADSGWQVLRQVDEDKTQRLQEMEKLRTEVLSQQASMLQCLFASGSYHVDCSMRYPVLGSS